LHTNNKTKREHQDETENKGNQSKEWLFNYINLKESYELSHTNRDCTSKRSTFDSQEEITKLGKKKNRINLKPNLVNYRCRKIIINSEKETRKHIKSLKVLYDVQKILSF